MFRIMLLVSNDEGQQGDGLARTRRHLQYTVTTGIERPLQVAHVVILFRIYAWIREKYREIIDEELHGSEYSLLRRGG